MAKIRAKSVNEYDSKSIDPEKESDRICAIVAYYYSKYSLSYLRHRMPYKDVLLMYRTIQREKADYFYNLTQIESAAYTQKRKGFKELANHYNNVMKENNG